MEHEASPVRPALCEQEQGENHGTASLSSESMA
jgi:hypothetical protein